MCLPVSNHCICSAILCGGGVLLISAITLLVVGILGATGSIQMASLGADWMIGIGAAMIVGIVFAGVRIWCDVSEKIYATNLYRILFQAPG